MGLSGSDHTQLVDLLLQATAELARAARGITDPKELARSAAQSVTRAKQALAAYSIPDAPDPAPKQLFQTLDGAFMSLYDLFNILNGHADPTVAKQAPSVQSVMLELSERFEPAGWKVPKTDAEGHTRQAAADKSGALNLTTAEKSSLGRLHIRAARQHILGGWKQVVDGTFTSMSTAASRELHEAVSVLLDPHLANDAAPVAAEVEATDRALDHVFMYLEANNPKAIGGLADLAKAADSLGALVGQPRRWVPRIGATAPTVAKQPATPGPASAPLAASSNAEPAAPRAEPGLHRIIETRKWTEKVHIKDTNYTDEYLGYIELLFEAYKTGSGQIYVTHAKATKQLIGRGGDFLSMGADVVSKSVEMNGHRYADVFFDIEIGGPDKTETTGFSAGAKLSAGSADKTQGAELSANVVFSTSTSSQGTRALRRVFRISSLDKPVRVMVPQSLDPEPQTIGMVSTERMDLHKDFEDFELDDDDVGDTVTSFYANWILHSYSD
ncbi:MAG: hypothetical protein H0T46_06970 [Deltaproteobacteria bacterium]|nr:hypothetical protein [Deltaproteobacteria bacterium]